MKVLFNVSIDTFGGILEDGTKAVCLRITDRDTDESYGLPIPIDMAKNLGQEIIRLANNCEKESD